MVGGIRTGIENFRDKIGEHLEHGLSTWLFGELGSAGLELPEHFDLLKRGMRANLETTVVEDHSHMLFIDPVDPMYQVPDSQPVQVPLC